MKPILALIALLFLHPAFGAVQGTVSYHTQTYNAGSGVATPHYGHKVYYPSSYANNSNSYPLIVFLHGIGERGTGDTQTELDKVDANGLPKLIEDGRSFESIIVCPQMPTSASFYENYVVDLVNWMKAQNSRIDINRVTVTGISAGGQIAWLCGAKFPGAFAGVAPISSVNMNTADTNAGVWMRREPVWAFNNHDDSSTPSSKSASWINAIVGGASYTVDCLASRPAFGTDTVQHVVPNGSGGFTWSAGSTVPTGVPRYTLYATGGHGMWERPYEDGLHAWLEAQVAAPLTMGALPYDFSILPSTPRALTITVDCSTMHPDQIKLSATSSATGVIANSGLVFSGTGSTRTLTITPTASTGSATITVTASDWSRATTDLNKRTVVGTFIAKVQTAAERVTDLEGQLASEKAAHLSTIASKDATIAARDATIATLTSDLSSANASVASLTAALGVANDKLEDIHALSAP